MKSGFYLKLAIDNIKKNPRLYMPRILAESGLLGCFYIAFALALDERLADVVGGAYVVTFMGLGTVVLGVLSFVLILYINSFLMKRRKSEYGLYNVLGMEKRHIIRVLFQESCCTSGCSYILGVILGILFYKISSLLVCRILKTQAIAGFYYINGKTILFPVLTFVAFDIIAFIVNSISVVKLNPVELLAEKNTGEKEPKVKWAMLIIGTASLSLGYWLALTVQTSMKALLWFFPAVFLVIIGTYCLFVTGSIFVLKCLKKNCAYYYNKNHMPAVAGLLFRMKQNAVGLSSIALLATGILIMISTTVALYSGMQDTLDNGYPHHLYLAATYHQQETVQSVPSYVLIEATQQASQANGLMVESVVAQHYLSAAYLFRDNQLLTKNEVKGGWDLDELTQMVVITEATYNELSGHEKYNLASNEIVFCAISGTIADKMLQPTALIIHGNEYTVRTIINAFPINGPDANAASTIGVIVADEAVLQDIYLWQKEGYGDYASEYTDRLAICFNDYNLAGEVSEELCYDIVDSIRDSYDDVDDFDITIATKWEAQENIVGMYGSFLFLGILLGFVCLFSTILIIYYKQISEGYEDRNRFQIMQKIGMEEGEVKKTIQSQMMLQFFLPLITAGIHSAVAFPMLIKMLMLLMLTDYTLAILCAIITYAVFAIVYIIVYLMTSKTYYKIVHLNKESRENGCIKS